ncbi:hypothetical protein H0N96_02410 [Candidatus Micrarchaeota archaeon]|nr:hypothetical protein [Candidatus Micrarchaeota archaeon]
MRLNKKRKAMIFTTDALLALAVITIATTAFTVFAAQTPEYGKQVQLAQLGRDYLKLGIRITDPDWFYRNTGLHVTTDQKDFANNALTVNALLYEYPDICRCTENSCQLERDACLKTQEIQNPDDIVRKVWVSP